MIDEFPNIQSALSAFNEVKDDRHIGIKILNVLVLRSEPKILVDIINFASKIIYTIFNQNIEDSSVNIETGYEYNLPEINPTKEQLKHMLTLSQIVPITMLNLNKYREKAKYMVDFVGDQSSSGEAAYRKYSYYSLFKLFKHGAKILWYGKIIEVLIGEKNHPLSQAWDEFLIVRYPSRFALRSILADKKYKKNSIHRVAGLERASVLQGEPIS